MARADLMRGNGVSVLGMTVCWTCSWLQCSSSVRRVSGAFGVRDAQRDAPITLAYVPCLARARTDILSVPEAQRVVSEAVHDSEPEVRGVWSFVELPSPPRSMRARSNVKPRGSSLQAGEARGVGRAKAQRVAYSPGARADSGVKAQVVVIGGHVEELE